MCVRLNVTNDRTSRPPDLFLFPWQRNANHWRRKRVVRVSGISNYCVRMCTYTVRVSESFSAGVSLYIFGEKNIKKIERCFPFFFSFRKKYFKKLLLEFFYKIICIGISHEHTAASNTPIIFLFLQYLDLCLFHYVIRRVSSQLKFDSLTE